MVPINKNIINSFKFNSYFDLNSEYKIGNFLAIVYESLGLTSYS